MSGAKRALVTGASGFIGSHVCRALATGGWHITGTFGRNEGHVPKTAGRIESRPLDLTKDASIDAALEAAQPDAVVHTAAMSVLRECEEQPESAQRINVDATARLAELCRQRGVRLVFFSTDQVFDGRRGMYREEDEPRPIHAYGHSKLEAERRIAESGAPATVLRASLVYGGSPSGRRSCTEQVVNAAREGRRLTFFVDEYRTPILVEDVAGMVAELFSGREAPLLHVAGPDRLNRVALGRAVFEAYGLEAATYAEVPLADAGVTPPRPPDVSLDTSLALRVLRHRPRGVLEGLRYLAAKA